MDDYCEEAQDDTDSVDDDSQIGCNKHLEPLAGLPQDKPVEDDMPPVKDGMPPVKDDMPPVKDGMPPVQDSSPLEHDSMPIVQDSLPHVGLTGDMELINNV